MEPVKCVNAKIIIIICILCLNFLKCLLIGSPFAGMAQCHTKCVFTLELVLV